MGAWAALHQLFGKREVLLAPMDDPFIQIDKGQVATQLKLREQGASQGQLNLPPAQMEAFDNVESEIVAYILEHYSRAQIDTANSIRTYDGRLGDLALLSKLSSIGTEARRAVSDFNAQVGNAINALSNSRDAITSSYTELAAFRVDNDLARPAHSAPPPISTFGAVALSWLFETAMNAFLLRLNDSMGYLGGIVAAATVGAINVLAAAFVGRQVCPRTNLRKPLDRAIAWIGVTLWVCLMLWWNLLAAHYRDAKSLGLPNPEKQALGMMGMGLESIYSWGLLFAGIIFAVTAARAGYRMDDPYPGYGDVTRRHNARCEDYANEVADATDDLTEIRDEAIEGATSVQEELGRQLGERQQILAARSAFSRRFDEFGTQIEQIANALLQDYRTANLAARTEPPPKHFTTRWTLPRSVLPAAPVFSVTDAEIRAAEASLKKAVAEITDAFTAAIDRFEPLDALKKRLTDG